ncbi:DUF6602 domain-containing protein [Enterococcus sp. AZ126]|uniref:DUF6602 domain-containing protein n=1 Tax=Enterococcus sp. AZ126 TaxID=2774635 RepID=UPI003F2656D0
MSDEQVLTGETVIKNIWKNYEQLEKSIVAQLDMVHDKHGTTIGTMREIIWQDLFRQSIPKKFVIEHSVFIIDSEGQISREVDLAIIDEMYTPYIFCYGKIKFIPIEAVAIVVECKSVVPEDKIIKPWYEAIQQLKTHNESIARLASYISTEAASTQQSTRPIRILCVKSIPDTKKKAYLEKYFDIILSTNANTQKILIDYAPDRTLWEWFTALNFHTIDSNDEKLEKVKEKGTDLETVTLKEYKIEGNPLLSFHFQLNQLLMLINNPMMFPHRKYVKMFQKNAPKVGGN